MFIVDSEDRNGLVKLFFRLCRVGAISSPLILINHLLARLE